MAAAVGEAPSGVTPQAHPELQPVPGLKENLSILDDGEVRGSDLQLR